MIRYDSGEAVSPNKEASQGDEKDGGSGNRDRIKFGTMRFRYSSRTT